MTVIMFRMAELATIASKKAIATVRLLAPYDG